MTYYTSNTSRRLKDRVNARRKAELKAAFWQFMGQALFTLIFAFFIAWVLVNWMMGCGETFYAADGSIIAGECLSLTFGAF